jgi:hypothetical protein
VLSWFIVLSCGEKARTSIPGNPGMSSLTHFSTSPPCLLGEVSSFFWPSESAI